MKVVSEAAVYLWRGFWGGMGLVLAFMAALQVAGWLLGGPGQP